MATYVIDVETNGRKPPEVIQLATRHIDLCDGTLLVGKASNAYFHPEEPSSAAALAVHHIIPELLVELAEQPSSECSLPHDAETIIGHWVDSDWEALGTPNVRRICTWAMAKYLLPELESYSLGALCYELLGSDARNLLKSAHDAAADVNACLELFNRLCQIANVKDFDAAHRISEEGKIPVYWEFGKYYKLGMEERRKVPIVEAPIRYLKWCLDEITDMDPYLKIAITRAIESKQTEQIKEADARAAIADEDIPF